MKSLLSPASCLLSCLACWLSFSAAWARNALNQKKEDDKKIVKQLQQEEEPQLNATRRKFNLPAAGQRALVARSPGQSKFAN